MRVPPVPRLWGPGTDCFLSHSRGAPQNVSSFSSRQNALISLIRMPIKNIPNSADHFAEIATLVPRAGKVTWVAGPELKALGPRASWQECTTWRYKFALKTVQNQPKSPLTRFD